MADTVRLTLAEVDALAMGALTSSNISDENARMIADTVVACERDGCSSHGLFRIPGFCASVLSGRVDGHARATPSRRAPGVLVVDAKGGFSAPAMRRARGPLVEAAREQGVAALTLFNTHHFGALWCDVEPLAEQGLVAMTFVNSTSFVSIFGSRKRIVGTNPLAFACPRPKGPPLVFDMATSASARGEINLAQIHGHKIPEGWAVDPEGRPTTDPATALKGSQLPFGGGHKGSAIALMVEVLAAGLTGGKFSFEAAAEQVKDGGPSNAGQLVIAIAPERVASPGLIERIEGLVERLHDAGIERIPGDRRRANRARIALAGAEVARAVYDKCVALAGDKAPPRRAG
ncbi:MAG: Ldh family oxidoreductase [Proteobacteria bacterium]|nr:Ldh family oxidoreductase [Pseudomonadota bacterium]